MSKLIPHKDHVLHLFYDKLYSCNMIAKEMKTSRQAVQQVLRMWGVDTSKAVAGWVEVTCAWCGRKKRVKRAEARARMEQGKENFCGLGCYREWYRKQMS